MPSSRDSKSMTLSNLLSFQIVKSEVPRYVFSDDFPNSEVARHIIKVVIMVIIIIFGSVSVQDCEHVYIQYPF